MMRSKIVWLKLMLFTRPSGISTPRLAIMPSRKMTRSLVITKLVVRHFTKRCNSHTAESTMAAVMTYIKNLRPVPGSS